MKGGGKRKGSSEDGNGVDVSQSQPQPQPQSTPSSLPLLPAPAPAAAEPLALVENDQTQLVNGEGEGTLVPQLSKLDDGFYEIETIRRKRVRKGQLQYLIKWRGWPETANTWEPLENLQSIPDVIDAFEASLKSGKHRKRKRKHVVHHTQPKKRLQRSTTSYSLRHFAPDSHPQSAPLPLSDIPTHPQTVAYADEGETNGDASGLGKPKQPNENGFANASNQIANDYDPKLSELKATNNGVDADKLTVHFQQDKASIGNGNVDGQSRVEPVQSGPCRGAKKRKSGSVKRFRRDLNAYEPVNTQNAVNMSAGGPGYVGNDGHKNMDDARSTCNIVRIIRPIAYAASLSSSVQDVSVTFTAVRSDGAEVMVDNKYLKAYNPLLLINFYEQHLRYSPASSAN